MHERQNNRRNDCDRLLKHGLSGSRWLNSAHAEVTGKLKEARLSAFWKGFNYDKGNIATDPSAGDHRSHLANTGKPIKRE